MGAAGQSLPEIHVVAAVLRDQRGVLIAERPAGKPMAGYWEFPGGKLEAGEPARQALQRELKEELGIEVRQAHRLLRLSHDYPERRVHLDVWRVTHYAGTPAAHEGQQLAWVAPEELKDWNLLPADEPIVVALKLPPLMLVTPDPDVETGFLESLQRSLRAGVDLVQLRAPGMEPERFDGLALAVMGMCREYGARVILNTSVDMALKLRASGLHLSQRQLRSVKPEDLDGSLLTGVSCHSAEEIHKALDYAPDYLCLGPVQASASHPGAEPLGWERYAELAALSPVPVYAIGGLKPGDLAEARLRGGHGIAAIRGLWNLSQLPEGS